MPSLHSDLSLNPQEDGPLVLDVAAIFQHITMLISINRRELLFRPEVGASLEPMLFEPVDDITSAAIYATLVDEMRIYDDRVSVVSNKSSIEPVPELNLYEVRFVFSVKGLTEEFEYSGQLISKFIS